MSRLDLIRGLDKTQITSLLGKPDKVTYLQNSFRPPDPAEDSEHYQSELRRWEESTPGEVWAYENPRLYLSISKAGQLISWSEE